MNVYLNRISHSEVHFGHLSDDLTDELNLYAHHGSRADAHIEKLQAQLFAFPSLH